MSGGGGGLDPFRTHTAKHTPLNSSLRLWLICQGREAFILPLTNEIKVATIILLSVCAVNEAETWGSSFWFRTSPAEPPPARPQWFGRIASCAAPRPYPRTDGGRWSGPRRRTVRLLSTARSAPLKMGGPRAVKARTINGRWGGWAPICRARPGQPRGRGPSRRRGDGVEHPYPKGK